MRKAIMLAVGDIPLELLCDLLEYNNIPASVIDGSELSVGELPKLIAEDKKSCFLVRNIDESYKQILASLQGLADNFVFLFASPTITLSHAIKVSKGSIEPEHIVESWSANLSEIIDYVGKDENYQLCDFSDLMSHPHAFLAELFDVDKAKNKDRIHDIENLLTDHISELTLTENHEAFELYDEVLAVSRLYGNFNAHLGISVDDLKLSALALGKTMFTQFASNELELKSKQDEVNTLLNENKDLTGKKALAEQLKRELDALEKNKQSGESKLNQELNEQKSLAEQMSVKLDALEQEKQSNESKLTKELTEHKSLVEDLTSKLNAQQASKESIQSELESVTNDFEETRSKVNALSSELATKEEALKSSHQKLTIQHKELNEQINTLNSDLKTLNEDRNSLKNKITDNEVLLKTRTEVISKLENDIKSENQRNSELEKQVSELTRAYEEKLTAKDKESKKISNSLVETQKALQVQSDSNADLVNALEIINAEYELLKMHMAQLQYELEVTHEQLKTTKYSSEILKDKVSDFDNIANKLACETREKMSAHEKVSKLLDKNKDLQEQYTTLMEEKRSTEEKLAAERQTAKGVVQNTEKMTKQLTQEREFTKRLQHEKNELQEQLNTFEVAMNNQSEYQQVELELASLQINQLQDELEYYFAALKNAQTQSREPSEVPKYYQDVFSKATSDSLTITGKYTTDGYNDAHLLLTDVQLADGRVFKELPIKLINVGGHVAIEFREDEDGSLFTHYEDMTDEYGPYLRFFANPSEASLAQQELVDSRMTASERIMVMSCILLIADLIQEQDVTCIADFSNEEWRNWRLTAFRLAETVQQAPNRLSFDSATLKEEYRIDNYEHLWLAFDSVLIGGVWRNNLELKVAARNVTNDGDDIFSDDISLEFRELDDGSAPLVTWPPVEADEYGPKFVVFLDGLDDLNKLAFSDRSLIEQIANNLSSIVDKIDDKSSKLVRSKSDWKKAINALLEDSNDVASQQVKDSSYSFVLDEVISMGTYEHILFVKENSDTKVKLKAKDINLETFIAEIFIELRNGSNEIIYNDTEFFGEDEYGPRVLVPFEVLLSDLIPNKREQFVWLIDVYEQVLKLIAGGSEIEPVVKKQWINMLNNQLEINSK